MLVKDFIAGPLKQEIKAMTIKNSNQTHAYLGFSLILQGIEFLGGCLDNYNWSEKLLSEKRFRLAIKKIFPDKYTKYNNKKNIFDLYSNLRCSMIHTFRPGNYIGLTELKNEGISKNTHLMEKQKKLILVFEVFLNDFINACDKVIDMINDNKLDSGKVYNNIINIPQENIYKSS